MYRSSLAAGVTGVALLSLLSFSVCAIGWSRDSGQERDSETGKFVAERLQTWQSRMNLQDWKIRVELVRANKLEPKTLGNIHWDTDVKSATIAVLAPEDYKLAHDAMLDDMEVTIVHELVHLELASLPRSDASRRVEERAVNEIAAALLRLSKR